MSREYLSIGCTPYNESCLQTGRDSNVHMRNECKVFMAQIERYYPIPDGCALLVKSNSHDFGTYYEVNAVFSPENEEHCRWAYDVESDILHKLEDWDNEAHEEIKQLISDNRLPSNYYTLCE